MIGKSEEAACNIPEELDTVTIECSVTANPPANIIWLKRTRKGIKKLISTLKTSITHQITFISRGPVTTSTLVISNVDTVDDGDYVCEARSSPSSPPVTANFSIIVISKSVYFRVWCRIKLRCMYSKINSEYLL